MRAIIRITLPEATDDQAVKIKKLIEKALKEEVIKRTIEMSFYTR